MYSAFACLLCKLPGRLVLGQPLRCTQHSLCAGLAVSLRFGYVDINQSLAVFLHKLVLFGRGRRRRRRLLSSAFLFFTLLSFTLWVIRLIYPVIRLIYCVNRTIYCVNRTIYKFVKNNAFGRQLSHFFLGQEPYSKININRLTVYSSTIECLLYPFGGQYFGSEMVAAE